MITHTPYFLKSNSKKAMQSRTRTSIPAFLLKSYELLQNEGHKDIVCWSEDGKSFLIKKHNEFRDQVLPQYFKHNNYSSFVRQLNMYDFHKVRNESTDSEYKNALFQKGQQKMLSEIKRKSGENYPNEEMSNNQCENIESSQNYPAQNNTFDGTQDFQMNKSEYNQFVTEVAKFKGKQKDLEKAMTMLIQQHEALLNENKILWEEIRRQTYIIVRMCFIANLIQNREQDEKRNDKFLLIMAFYLGNYNAANNSASNNQRTISIPQQNRKNIFPGKLLPQPFLHEVYCISSGALDNFDMDNQNYSYNKDEIHKFIQDFNGIKNNSLPADIVKRVHPSQLILTFFTSQKGNNVNMPVLSLPKNKKHRPEFSSNISNQQIQKLFEHYQQGDKQNQDRIISYLQNIINSRNPCDKRASQNKYLSYEPPSPPVKDDGYSAIQHDKPFISMFENYNMKRICDDTDTNRNIKSLTNSNEKHQLIVKAKESLPQYNDTNLSMKQLLTAKNNTISQSPNNNMIADLFGNISTGGINNMSLNSQVNQNTNLNNDPIMHNFLNQNQNTAASSQPNSLFLSRSNSVNMSIGNDQKYFTELGMPPQIKYSSSPVQHPLEMGNQHIMMDNSSILHSPSYFNHINGSFTPTHNYVDDDVFFIRSRGGSFHISDKIHDSPINSYPSIN